MQRMILLMSDRNLPRRCKIIDVFIQLPVAFIIYNVLETAAIVSIFIVIFSVRNKYLYKNQFLLSSEIQYLNEMLPSLKIK